MKKFMNQEIQMFLEQSDKIRLWGAINRRFTDDIKVCYRLSFEERIFVDLVETDFTITISLVFGKVIESYNLTLGKFNNEFLKSQKDTQERYGQSYNIPPAQIISMIEEQLSKVNMNEVIENKLVSGLGNMLENNIPEVFINGLHERRFETYHAHMPEKERKTLEEERNTYRNVRNNWELKELTKTLEGISKHKMFLSFIPYDQDMTKYGLPTLEKIQEILINSDVMIRKNKNLKKAFNGELNIEIKDDKLYLGLEFIDRIA